MFGFLFWLFLIGIIVASIQDLKRQEVDNWLNLFLLVISFSLLFFKSVFENESSLFLQAGFFLFMMYFLANLFYHGRVFAGGDAKLLVAMTALFITGSFGSTMGNIVTFVFFLMVSGSVYGFIYSLILYFKNFKKVNVEIKKEIRNPLFIYALMAGISLMIMGFVQWVFIPISILFLFFPLLYVFAKGLERVSMVRTVSGKDLREGDWLVKDVAVGRKVVRVDWDGLSLEDLELMKNLKKVKIKGGLPFVPAFLIAFFLYTFWRVKFLEFLFNIF